MTGRLVAILLLVGLWAPGQQKVNPSSAALSDFGRRVAAYVKVRKDVESQVHTLKPTNSAEEIQDHQQELAQGIREARRDARHGDIFTPEITAEFRRLIGGTMRGQQAARIRQSLRSGSPVGPQAISVNASYPPVPLQSTPPSLLGNLPALPQGLDYRLIGPNLVLRDVEANLILDYIPNVIS